MDRGRAQGGARHEARSNFTLKLSAPGFGPGLKPLVQMQFGGRHAA